MSASASSRRRLDFYSRPCGRGDPYNRYSPRDEKYHFYSRPCGRGDYCLPPQTQRRRYFYSRPCGRGDQVQRSSQTVAQKFLLTPLREGRPAHPAAKRRGLLISTHAPAGGATGPGAVIWFQSLHFYSRPCGRGDAGGMWRKNYGKIISTHAPAGGATRRSAAGKCRQKISTHAPAGGATAKCRDVSASGWISTHAPAGGATGCWMAQLISQIFLLTPLREGRRGEVFDGNDSSDYFYSRPCGRGDWRYVEEELWKDYFYSRPCGRGDKLWCETRVGVGEFLLTPLREGRREATNRNRKRRDFYSRPCGRGDSACTWKNAHTGSFLLTPLREGRRTGI